MRLCVVRNLRALLDADPDVSKSHAIEKLLLDLSLDVADEVSEAAVATLAPATVAWLLRVDGDAG